MNDLEWLFHVKILFGQQGCHTLTFSCCLNIKPPVSQVDHSQLERLNQIEEMPRGCVVVC